MVVAGAVLQLTYILGLVLYELGAAIWWMSVKLGSLTLPGAVCMKDGCSECRY